MTTKIMKTSITSEMVSQNTICREMEGSGKDWEVPEIAKKVPQASSKDNKHDNDQSSEGNGTNCQKFEQRERSLF